MKAILKKTLCIILALAMCVGLAACGEKGNDNPNPNPPQNGPEPLAPVVDPIERGIGGEEPAGTREVKDFSFAEEETQNVNPENLSAEFAGGVSVKLSSTVLEGDAQLTAKRASASPAIYDDSEAHFVYNFELNVDGQSVHELDGRAEITIPVGAVADTERVLAAYYNESTDSWDPVMFRYENGNVVITTNHFSNFGAFIVNRSNTRYAYLEYNYINWSDQPELVLAAKLVELFSTDNPVKKAADWTAETYGSVSQIGIDIGYNAIKAGGFENAFLEKYGDTIGYIGVAFTSYQIMSMAINGGHEPEIAGNTLKVGLGQFMNWATKAVATPALYASFASIAVLDYALNKMATETWNARKDLYRAAYNMYYTQGDGVRTTKQWRELFWPAFTKEKMTEERLTALIDAYVRKYCDQFWEDETQVAYYLNEATNLVTTGGGGLNEAIKAEISENYRQYLYANVLPAVFEDISKDMELATYDLMRDRLIQYAKMMNEVITINVKDSSVKDGQQSQYAGATLKFKNLPVVLNDPQNWECILDENGCGKIQFRLFAYANAGMTNDFVIEKDDKVLLEFTQELCVPDTEIDLNMGGEISGNQLICSKVEGLENAVLSNPSITEPVTLWTPGNNIIQSSQHVFTASIKDISITLLEVPIQMDEKGKITAQDYDIDLTGQLDLKTGKGEGTVTFKPDLYFSTEPEESPLIQGNLDADPSSVTIVQGELKCSFTVAKNGNQLVFSFSGNGNYRYEYSYYSTVRCSDENGGMPWTVSKEEGAANVIAGNIEKAEFTAYYEMQ